MSAGQETSMRDACGGDADVIEGELISSVEKGRAFPAAPDDLEQGFE
jgi:hypothetical protein